MHTCVMATPSEQQTPTTIMSILVRALYAGNYVKRGDNTFTTTFNGTIYTICFDDPKQRSGSAFAIAMGDCDHVVVSYDDMTIKYTKHNMVMGQFIAIMRTLLHSINYRGMGVLDIADWPVFYEIYRYLRNGPIRMKYWGGTCHALERLDYDPGVIVTYDEFGTIVPATMLYYSHNGRHEDSRICNLSDLMELNAEEIAHQLPEGDSMDRLQSRFAEECAQLECRAASMSASATLQMVMSNTPTYCDLILRLMQL